MRSRFLKYAAVPCLLFAGLLVYFITQVADSDGPVGPCQRLVIDLASPTIPQNSLVGKTEAEVLHIWGQPHKEWMGHYGNPPDDYITQNSPARTLMFRRWTGALYVSLKEQNGEWVCFSSDWLPKGWAFKRLATAR
jgi:hypothetical protein